MQIFSCFLVMIQYFILYHQEQLMQIEILVQVVNTACQKQIKNIPLYIIMGQFHLMNYQAFTLLLQNMQICCLKITALMKHVL